MRWILVAAALAAGLVNLASASFAQPRPLPSWSDTALVTAPARLPRVTMNEERIVVAPGDSGTLSLGSATRGIVEVRTSAPVDIFVARADQAQGLRAAMAGETGPEPQVIDLRRSVRSASIDWTAPDRRFYFLFIENAAFPAGGASPRDTVTGTVTTYGLVPPPGDPQSGRGLLVGQLELKTRNARGRVAPYRGPRRLRLRHVALEPGADSRPALTYLETDDSGFFYFSNVPAQRAWWIEGVEGVGFTVLITDPPAFDGAEWRLPRTAVVHDTGHPAISAVADLGSFTVVVDTAHNRLVRAEARTSTARISTTPRGAWQTRRDVRGPLTRHDWFLAYFGNRPWAATVRAHRDATEQERRPPSRAARNASRNRR